MSSLLKSSVGRLRLLGYLEGSSLLVLVFIAVPLKHLYNDPFLVRIIGPVHGMLFTLFVINTISVGTEHGWKFKTTTWKVLLACMIPFGTFYIDRAVFRTMSK
jgi:integral membrane protein